MSLQEDGIRAFGFWEPKTFQIRRGGYENGQSVDQVYDWFDSETFIQQLKAAGFNLYITHFSKGAGIEAEREERMAFSFGPSLAHNHVKRLPFAFLALFNKLVNIPCFGLRIEIEYDSPGYAEISNNRCIFAPCFVF